MLHLTLHKKWFDLIASGRKKIEYREVKPYWVKRLKNRPGLIFFRNGYSPSNPYLICKCVDIILNPAKNRFEIHLGRIINRGHGKVSII